MIKEESLTKLTLANLKKKYSHTYSFEKNRVTSMVGKKGKPDVSCFSKNKEYLDFNIEFKNIKKDIKKEYDVNRTGRYLFQISYARKIVTPTVFYNYYDNTYFITNSTLYSTGKESELYKIDNLIKNFTDLLTQIKKSML